MKTIVIFLVVILSLTAESAFRGKSHKTQSKAVKEEGVPEPVEDVDDDVEWPQPPKIKSFGTDENNSAHGGDEADDHTKSRQHGKASRKSHSH